MRAGASRSSAPQGDRADDFATFLLSFRVFLVRAFLFALFGAFRDDAIGDVREHPLAPLLHFGDFLREHFGEVEAADALRRFQAALRVENLIGQVLEFHPFGGSHHKDLTRMPVCASATSSGYSQTGQTRTSRKTARGLPQP